MPLNHFYLGINITELMIHLKERPWVNMKGIRLRPSEEGGGLQTFERNVQ